MKICDRCLSKDSLQWHSLMLHRALDLCSTCMEGLEEVVENYVGRLPPEDEVHPGYRDSKERYLIRTASMQVIDHPRRWIEEVILHGHTDNGDAWVFIQGAALPTLVKRSDLYFTREEAEKALNN